MKVTIHDVDILTLNGFQLNSSERRHIPVFKMIFSNVSYGLSLLRIFPDYYGPVHNSVRTKLNANINNYKYFKLSENNKAKIIVALCSNIFLSN
jgi:hypothetical protein